MECPAFQVKWATRVSQDSRVCEVYQEIHLMGYLDHLVHLVVPETKGMMGEMVRVDVRALQVLKVTRVAPAKCAHLGLREKRESMDSRASLAVLDHVACQAFEVMWAHQETMDPWDNLDRLDLMAHPGNQDLQDTPEKKEISTACLHSQVNLGNQAHQATQAHQAFLDKRVTAVCQGNLDFLETPECLARRERLD